MGPDIKSPPGNGPYCFRIHGQVYPLNSTLYPNKANKSGYRQIHIFDSAQAITKLLGNEPNKGRMAEEMARLLSYKGMEHKKLNK
jgi:hypothetical protein